jgi:hypothetical protein
MRVFPCGVGAVSPGAGNPWKSCPNWIARTDEEPKALVNIENI